MQSEASYLVQVWTCGVTVYLMRDGAPERFPSRQAALDAGDAVLFESPDSSFVVESDRIGHPSDDVD